MCIAFVFQSLSESPNQDGTMKWYNGISVQMSCFKRFIFSIIDAALFSLAFSCILTFNIMRRGRNTARGKSILVAGPIHVHKKRELAQNLLDLHFLEACLNKQQQHFEKCCSLYFARILIFKINNVVKLVQKSLASLQENIFLRISNFIPTQPRLRASIYHSFYNIQLAIYAVLTLYNIPLEFFLCILHQLYTNSF